MIRTIFLFCAALIFSSVGAEIIMPPHFLGLEADARSTVLCIRLFDHEFEKYKFGPAIQAKIRAIEHLADVLQKAQPVHLDKLDRQIIRDDIKRSVNSVNLDRLAEAIASGVTWKQPGGYTRQNRLFSLAFECNKYTRDEPEEWKYYLSQLK